MVNPTSRAGNGGAAGAPIHDIMDRLAAPFAESEVRVRQGPRGPLRYITARTARRRLNEVLGGAWECRVEPAEKWVRCSLTIHLPDGRSLTREALGGYPDMPSEEDRVKGGDSDAFKRACCLFGVGEYLGDPDLSPEVIQPGSRGVLAGRRVTSAAVTDDTHPRKIVHSTIWVSSSG